MASSDQGGVEDGGDEDALRASPPPPPQEQPRLNKNPFLVTESNEQTEEEVNDPPLTPAAKSNGSGTCSKIHQGDGASPVSPPSAPPVAQRTRSDTPPSAPPQPPSLAEEEWDFDEDSDIFNEGNDALGIEDGGEGDMLEEEGKEEALAESSDRASGATPPPPPLPRKLQQLNENPFLINESNGVKGGINDPALIPAAESNGSGNANKVHQDDGDGWSDEDFFDEDDGISSSSSKPTALPIPPPPPSSFAPPAAALAPPAAQGTRGKTPSPVPAVQPTDVAEFNPSQRRTHQMLSNYVASLHDAGFLTRLHRKLQLHQQTAAAGDLREYYAARPGLRKYTLGVELDRMDYELILGNGKRTTDKDVIRGYFGADGDGDGEGMHYAEGDEVVATTEELLVRSANQSLLADMLVALTGPEENINGVGNGWGDAGSAGLILSGPTLCMTSVAESCRFTLDLQSGQVEAACLLAISVPFHASDAAAADGRLVLARAEVSVHFNLEGGNSNDEPTVQYAVQSVTPFHSPDSVSLRRAAVSLARDQHDPFSRNEGGEEAEGADARDQFLLSHHLLSAADSAALLAVSRDHIDKLKGAAVHSSTGFRSALRQLDDVANVSAKLGGLSGGFEGLGLALPSAAEIEAAEREAREAAGRDVRRAPPSGAGARFPRPHDVPDENLSGPRGRELRAAPPRHLPPPPAVAERPRPLIGGLFMSGLSRLAAAATQPDEQPPRPSWSGGGGTGLTPPGSPPPAGNGVAGNECPTLYRKEENEQSWMDEPRGYTGLTPSAAKQPAQRLNHFDEFVPPASTPSSLSAAMETAENNIDEGEEQGVGPVEDEEAGWSDDEFDFEDENSSDNKDDRKDQALDGEKMKEQETNLPVMGSTLTSVCEASESKEEPIPIDGGRRSPIPEKTELHQHFESMSGGAKTVLPVPPVHPPPPLAPQQPRTFEEEFVIVLKEKIEAECQEMKKTGRMKRWVPLREDKMLRKRLMEVMVAQINS